MDTLLELLIALVVVFFAAQIFTNALECMGEKLGVSEGVTGSIFAAVGTAMPETIVPIVAIVAGGASEAINREVGMGAILGAPFMLATLSIGLMAVFAGLRRGWHAEMRPEKSGMSRDSVTFFIAYGLVVITALLPTAWHAIRTLMAISLFVIYFLYLLYTIRASKKLVDDGHHTEADDELYVGRFLGHSMWAVGAQLIASLALLVWGARLFVHGVEHASAAIGMSALAVSLLIVPIATELPEKVNSILWIRKSKDTLAFGNITGAMVFQGTIIPAVGMLLLPSWSLSDPYAATAVVLALIGSGWLWFLRQAGKLTPFFLTAGIGFYAIFVFYVIVA